MLTQTQSIHCKPLLSVAFFKMNKTCDACVNLFENAAFLLSSGSDKQLATDYTTDYQSQLMANVSLSKCHMCSLIAGNIPRSIESLGFAKELLEFTIDKITDDTDAITLGLTGHTTNWALPYVGSLLIQDGQQ